MKNIHPLLQRHHADALLLTSLPDIRWACGFTGSNGLLFVEEEGSHFVTDGRYTVQARHEVQGAGVAIAEGDLLEEAAEKGRLGAARRVVFQSEHVSYDRFQRMQRLFPDVEWIPVEGLLSEEVAAKTPEEVDRLRRAQRITDDVFTYLLDVLRPGMTEKEVAAEIVYQHLRRGADAMSFDPIVASGAQGALPHARPSAKRIEKGDLVVLDFGCYLDGYASDMTRTVAVGTPSEDARAVYQLVLDAQEAALEGARSGMKASDLDGLARGVIEAGGYGAYFTHSLGHGIGLQVHEWPRLARTVDAVLPEGTAVTIEPGVYLPDRFGVRIEDMVVLHPEGGENLTRSPKALTVL